MCHAYIPHTGAGAETSLHDLLRAAVDAGHTVDVLLSQNRGASERYELDGVRVHPFVDTGDPFRWFGTDDNSPHVVVSQLQNTNRAAVLARMYHIPHVQVIHNDMDPTRHYLRLGPADLVVYNTEWVQKSLEAWLWSNDHAVPSNATVIHPPVRVEDYELPAGTKGDRITLINMYPQKGSDVFYELARRMPDRKFLGICGHYGDQVIQDLPNIELIGPIRPDRMVDEVYARTKVLLVPSHYESYGRVAIEAACAGIPVIASTAHGLVEALGENGTCLDRSDVDAWEAELTKLLSPRGWSAASKRSKAVAANLTTEADLGRFVKELEAVAKVRV